MQRVVEPEWLDELPAEDPRAIHSRADIRRLNWFMNNPGTVARVLRDLPAPKRVLDLGAGDGSFALRVAQLCEWREIECVLLDRSPSVPDSVRAGFRALNCPMTVLQRDALAGLQDAGNVEAIFSNLFLHHFKQTQLNQLLADAAAHCRFFVACEPRRSPFALFVSRCLGLIGCNGVTRHDAPASVRAGFRGSELTQHWPVRTNWSLHERPAGLFSHLFVACKL
ncbi:MAG TPA: methyltransferase domain-containing protein [Methylomirabilota bacterium]|nr:methyltransferase domain-containing protein [Methylomirabilota bacterium]